MKVRCYHLNFLCYLVTLMIAVLVSSRTVF